MIEVATFRRQLQPGEEAAPAARARAGAQHEPAAHHDNTFGTPEEDAFRRDFTINALFYDIATFSIIDYVNGMDDLHAGIVRSIGDPEERFKEDPVRMLRAVALAARLNFTIDPPVLEAIRLHRHEIARSSPARLLEEYYKILRSGYSERIFRGLAEAGLLEPISAELHRSAGEPLWRIARGAGRVSGTVRERPRDAHQSGAARQPARPGGLHAADAAARAARRERRRTCGARIRVHDWAICRSPGAMSSGSARYFSCSGAFTT